MENTKNKIIAIIRENLAREERDNGLFKTAREALRPFEGKAITKRCGNAIRKALDKRDGPRTWEVYYKYEYGQYKVDIYPRTAPGEKWEKCPDGLYADTQNGLTLYLGGAWDAIYTENGRPTEGGKVKDGFNQASAFAGAAAEKRVELRRALLADDKKLERLAAAVDAYNDARRALLGEGGLLRAWNDDAGDREIPDCYAIEKLLDGENK